MYTTIVFAIVAVAAASGIGFFYIKRRVDKVEKRLDESPPSESEEIEKSALQDFGVKEETKEGDKVMMFGRRFRAEKGNGSCHGCDIIEIRNSLGLSSWDCMNAMKCSWEGRIDFNDIIYKSAPMEAPQIQESKKLTNHRD